MTRIKVFLNTLFLFFNLYLIWGTFTLSGLYHDKTGNWEKYIQNSYLWLDANEKIIMFGVVWISVFWIIQNVISNSVLGFLGGDSKDGFRVGLIFGIGRFCYRIGPYVIAWGVGSVMFSANPYWPSIFYFILAVTLLVLGFVIKKIKQTN